MKFSTKTTYGIRSMTRLDRIYRKGSLSLATIAKEQNISLSYLERIFSSLKKAGLVKAEVGASGGYTLSRCARNITALEIVEALEGQVSPFKCIHKHGEVKCRAGKYCEVPKVLIKVQDAVVSTLSKINLSDLIK